MSTLPLRRAIAADWVRWSLLERGIPTAGARVAVCAASLTGEVVRTVTELVLRHRYVLLDLPYGGGDLCRQLRREQLEGAEAAVLFDPRTDCRGSGRILLYDEKEPLPPLGLPPALEEKLPDGVNRGQLLSVLREAGSIRQIPVGS